MNHLCIASLVLVAVFSADALAGEQDYSPHVNDDYPQRVYWGDTHLHSSFSSDAGMFGNNLGPEAAYEFARGEVVTASNGQKARLVAPLDFLVVSDHSETMGLAPMLAEANPLLLATEFGAKLFKFVSAGQTEAAFRAWAAGMTSGKDPMNDPALLSSMWKRLTDVAERYNKPGEFTALIGYEWSSVPAANNLHRVVVYRDGADKARKMLPFSSFDSNDPERLWDWMAAYEADTGGRLLAIPHNGNLSNGLMFATETMEGKPLDAEYAKRRMRWEPIVEMTQMKGDGETHPLLSPGDEFADFETWDTGNFGYAAKAPDMLPHEYARSALRLGLAQQQQHGGNPFQFGMIGSTDSHTSLATAAEDNFFGKVSLVEPSANVSRFEEKIVDNRSPALTSDISISHWQSSAGGLAAVWARENTREALFDAFQRKEVYATTGSRMTLRLFGGWGFAADDSTRPNFVQIGYQGGVPMGGTLSNAGRRAPRFLAQAAKDPNGANLDRLQIVKGWVDRHGATHEHVYDIALSDSKRKRWNGSVAPIDSTVDAAAATYRNTVGAVQLSAWWKDPEFDPKQNAFYYLRAIEIPTPRWTTIDAARFGVTVPKKAPLEIQERGYSSPIWYQPTSPQ